MPIHYKTRETIEVMREGAAILNGALAEVAKSILPGTTTAALDTIAETFIRDHHAIPSFKGYQGFPAAICASLNNQVIHGVPGDKQMLRAGDIISIDCGVYYKGYHTDAAFTFPVGDVVKKTLHLLAVTKQALYQGIASATVQHRLGDVGHAIQTHIEQYGYSVVRTYGGHGVGKELHESPHVHNFGKKGSGPRLKEGMVLAIEPLVNMGTKEVFEDSATGVVCTCDQQLSAHFEHTVAIVDGMPDILTSYKPIEKALQNIYA